MFIDTLIVIHNEMIKKSAEHFMYFNFYFMINDKSL